MSSGTIQELGEIISAGNQEVQLEISWSLFRAENNYSLEMSLKGVGEGVEVK